MVQTVIRSSRELQPITDAYGTDCRLVPMLETTVLDADAVRETVTDTVSVRLDSLRKVRTIMCLTADCGRPRAEKDSVRVPVSVKAVCMMEDGKPELLTGRGEALCPGSGSIPEATAGEPYVSVTALGLEVRVPVSFSVTRCSREELRRLISAEAVSFEPREPTPSVTILRASQGDSVWSLGKARSLPCASIRAYNQRQEGEEPTPGTLLLLAR